ncbi:MAG: hypothetical protein ABI222_17235 [Opitutaceae bacterium]
MPDRLDELRKQRALVQQHLTWLDHEIAAVTVTRLTLPPFAMRSGATRPPIPGATNAPMAAATPASLRPAMNPAAIPELAEFQVDPDDVHGDTRRGCILYAAIAVIVMVLICGVIYFVGYRDRPVLFVPDREPQKMVYPVAPHPAPAKPATPNAAPAIQPAKPSK